MNAKQNPSALINSDDIITLPDKTDRWWFLTVSMGDVTPPTEEIVSVNIISRHWNSAEWEILLIIDYLCLYQHSWNASCPIKVLGGN